jgi:hypothetical protein
MHSVSKLYDQKEIGMEKLSMLATMYCVLPKRTEGIHEILKMPLLSRIEASFQRIWKSTQKSRNPGWNLSLQTFSK